MTNFRNLKIAINDQQPLDEVVIYLESEGYRKEELSENYGDFCNVDLFYKKYRFTHLSYSHCKTTTLAELKEM